MVGKGGGGGGEQTNEAMSSEKRATYFSRKGHICW